MDLWPLPEPMNSALLEEVLALALNLLGSETRGGILAIDRAARSIVYSYSFDLETTDSIAFQNGIDNFIDVAATLREQLQVWSHLDFKVHDHVSLDLT